MPLLALTSSKQTQAQSAALDLASNYNNVAFPRIVLLLFIFQSVYTHSSSAKSGPAHSLDVLISGAALGTARGKASP